MNGEKKSELSWEEILCWGLIIIAIIAFVLFIEIRISALEKSRPKVQTTYYGDKIKKELLIEGDDGQRYIVFDSDK